MNTPMSDTERTEGGRSPDGAGLLPTVEPVPVSPLRAAIPSAFTNEDWFYLWKWVERGLFDHCVTAKEALSVLAHSPCAPWNHMRWDVDHKPYGAELYRQFPRAQGTEARRAETGTGSVYDGPVAESDAPNPSRNPTYPNQSKTV